MQQDDEPIIYHLEDHECALLDRDNRTEREHVERRAVETARRIRRPVSVCCPSGETCYFVATENGRILPHEKSHARDEAPPDLFFVGDKTVKIQWPSGIPHERVQELLDSAGRNYRKAQDLLQKVGAVFANLDDGTPGYSGAYPVLDTNAQSLLESMAIEAEHQKLYYYQLSETDQTDLDTIRVFLDAIEQKIDQGGPAKEAQLRASWKNEIKTMREAIEAAEARAR